VAEWWRGGALEGALVRAMYATILRREVTKKDLGVKRVMGRGKRVCYETVGR